MPFGGGKGLILVKNETGGVKYIFSDKNAYICSDINLLTNNNLK